MAVHAGKVEAAAGALNLEKQKGKTYGLLYKIMFIKMLNGTGSKTECDFLDVFPPQERGLPRKQKLFQK